MDVNEIISAVKEGRVIVLPCKPGETVYEVQYNTEACKQCNWFHSGGFNVDDYCHNKNEYAVSPEHHSDDNVCPKHFLEVKAHPFVPFRDLDRIGTSIFLSQTEAAAAIFGVYAGSIVDVDYSFEQPENPMIEMIVSFALIGDDHVSIVGHEKNGKRTLFFNVEDIGKGVFPKNPDFVPEKRSFYATLDNERRP